MITMELEGKINLSFVPFGCGGGHSSLLGPAAVSFECWGGEDDRERGNTEYSSDEARKSNEQ